MRTQLLRRLFNWVLVAVLGLLLVGSPVSRPALASAFTAGNIKAFRGGSGSGLLVETETPTVTATEVTPTPTPTPTDTLTPTSSPTPTPTATSASGGTHLVISQIYGGGGDSGAT